MINTVKELKNDGGDNSGRRVSEAEQSSLGVTVCACTYKRPDGLAALLAGLVKQEFSSVPSPRWDIVIADNEGSAEARAICENFQGSFPISLAYVHEPKRGISHARNACLDHIPAESDFFAMIDDDEVPEPDWLDQLLHVQQATDADVVLGRVMPKFDPSVPSWLTESGFFGSPTRRPGREDETYSDQQEIGGAATNNVLVRCSNVRRLNLRFDPVRSLSGGEDSLFFRTLALAGARIVFAAKARVSETVPKDRTNLRYLVQTEFRSGNLKFGTKLQTTKANVGRIEVARVALKTWSRGFIAIGHGAFEVIGSLFNPRRKMDRFAMGAMRMANGVGMLTGVFGVKYDHYR